ncbi:MAG: DUF1636 domain-containing protein [Alphaproteobacteria bacterium]|nr:MAG: DUF1636 domain-containing protein [Alphaproteobacteria bacterium]
MTARVSVCVSCAGGSALADALARDVAINRVDCMNVCTKPACLSVREAGKAAYLFGDVSAEMADNVRTFLGLYEDAEAGIIEDARPIGKLRFCLIGRIPP